MAQFFATANPVEIDAGDYPTVSHLIAWATTEILPSSDPMTFAVKADGAVLTREMALPRDVHVIELIGAPVDDDAPTPDTAPATAPTHGVRVAGTVEPTSAP